MKHHHYCAALLLIMASYSQHVVCMDMDKENRFNESEKFKPSLSQRLDFWHKRSGAAASCNRDIVRRWTVGNITPEIVLSKEDARHTSLALGVDTSIDANSSIIALGRADGVVDLRDLETGDIRFSKKLAEKPINALAFTADGRTLFAGLSDGQIIKYSISHGVFYPAGIYDNTNKDLRSIVIAPQKGHVAFGTSSSMLKVFDTEGENIIKTLSLGDVAAPTSGPSTAFNSAGDLLGAALGSTIKMWNTSSFNQLVKHDVGATVQPLVFSPNGRWLVAGLSDGRIVFINTLRGQIEISLTDPTLSSDNPSDSRITSLAFSNDTQLLAAGTKGNKVYLWDMVTKKTIRTLQSEHKAPFVGLVFSADGKILVARQSDGSVSMWKASCEKDVLNKSFILTTRTN